VWLEYCSLPVSNSGVSIEAVRRRLGHASTETTQLYALLDDKVADAEIAPHAADGVGQRADRPCAEQAQRNRV
jgi:integrase